MEFCTEAEVFYNQICDTILVKILHKEKKSKHKKI